MQRLKVYGVLLALAVAFTGCSQETQREAKEALDKTGEAVESAAEDAANATEGAIKGASEAVDENRAKPDAEQPK